MAIGRAVWLCRSICEPGPPGKIASTKMSSWSCWARAGVAIARAAVIAGMRVRGMVSLRWRYRARKRRHPRCLCRGACGELHPTTRGGRGKGSGRLWGLLGDHAVDGLADNPGPGLFELDE